jgi:tRNA threonylcarbamoyladenosine biosynthesis protein TsaB
VILLALDTSSPGGSVAVLRHGRVIGAVSTRTDEAYSSRLFRHVEMLLRELGLGLGQMEAFALTSGPGSFTGLRVGLAAVKGWAEVYRRPVVAVSVLEAIAAQSRAASETLVPVFDARRGEVYFGIYRRQEGLASGMLAAEGEASVATPEEFFASVETKAGNSTFTVVTPTPEVLAAASGRWTEVAGRGRPVAVEAVSGLLAPIVGELAYRRVQAGEVADLLTLDANYVRRTDAELKWKGF